MVLHQPATNNVTIKIITYNNLVPIVASQKAFYIDTWTFQQLDKKFGRSASPIKLNKKKHSNYRSN